jgi:hypothetical protein
MDASTLGQRFTMLSISVVVRGCAIPVAWRIVEATKPGAWRPHWTALGGAGCLFYHASTATASFSRQEGVFSTVRENA